LNSSIAELPSPIGRGAGGEGRKGVGRGRGRLGSGPGVRSIAGHLRGARGRGKTSGAVPEAKGD